MKNNNLEDSIDFNKLAASTQPHTFGYYAVNSVMPSYIKINKPVDKKELQRILNEIYKKEPSKYKNYVKDIKDMGDRLSTYEALTIGMDEISPDKPKRDRIVKKYDSLLNQAKSDDEKIKYYEKAQKELSDLNMSKKDDASFMVESAIGGKANQLMKARTTPYAVKDFKGNIAPKTFNKSYAEGVDPLRYFYGAGESRKNLVESNIATSGPGEMSKVFANTMNDSVVSVDDCKTDNGISLFTKDEDVLDRFLAHPAGGYKKNTLITSEVQQNLLKKKIDKIVVRSPQTCEANGNTVCSKCYGSYSHNGKSPRIGDNVGIQSSQAMAEPLTQLALSSKHSTTMAEKDDKLKGLSGLKQVTEMPKEYPNRKVICEVYGEVYWIQRSSTGGHIVKIRQTRKVPDKYIIHAKQDENNDRIWIYDISPRRKLLVKKGQEVYPGLELTDGFENIEDVARLRGLGAARSALAENVQSVFKNTGQSIDRRHTEMLGRSMFRYAKLDNSSKSLGLNKGDVVEYSSLQSKMNNLNKKEKNVEDALGLTLSKPYLHYLSGTELTKPIIDDLKRNNIKRVKVTDEVSVSPFVTPVTRAPLNRTDQWVSNLQHRYLKDTIKDAAQQNYKENLHGYNPISSYAYGVEMTKKPDGRY